MFYSLAIIIRKANSCLSLKPTTNINFFIKPFLISLIQNSLSSFKLFWALVAQLSPSTLSYLIDSSLGTELTLTPFSNIHSTLHIVSLRYIVVSIGKGGDGQGGRLLRSTSLLLWHWSLWYRSLSEEVLACGCFLWALLWEGTVRMARGSREGECAPGDGGRRIGGAGHYGQVG